MFGAFQPSNGKNNTSHKSHCIFELEFDGYVFGRVAMLARDLNGISKSPCHKKARFFPAQINH